MNAPRALAHVMLALAVGSFLLAPALLHASAILGTVRGPQPAKLSLNGGKSWLALGGRSLPVMAGTEIRTAAGHARLTLSDGSRISVMPFSSLTFAETTRGTQVSLVYGRLAFSLSEGTTTEIRTPTARLEPIAGQAMEGEVFVTGRGLTGLQMSRGTLNVRHLSQPNHVMLASVEPVFLPARPSMPGVYFSVDSPPRPAVNARGIFTPDGRSIGYLGRDGVLVIAPGYTRNLTRAFSPKLVRVAMNAIPEQDRTEDATPLFDVNGGYVGYLSGPVFYPQAATAQAIEPTSAQVAPVAAATGGSVGLSTGTIATIGATAAGVGAASVVGSGALGAGTSTQSDECPPPPATPTQPPGCGS